MTIWLWLAAPLIGVMLGLFGAGGGMLTVPLLIYGVGLPVKEAVATSLWIVATVSLIAATQQRAWRVVRLDLLAFFGSGGMAGGVLGAWIGTWIASWIQQSLFAVLLLAVAVWMRRVRVSETHEETPCHCGTAMLTGAALGVTTGLLGVGGGFLMVPALLLLGISHLPTAVAHSLVMVALHATAAGMVYLGEIPQSPRLIVTIAVLAGAGSILGSHLLWRMPRQRLQAGFSIGLGILGIAMLGQLVLTHLH